MNSKISWQQALRKYKYENQSICMTSIQEITDQSRKHHTESPQHIEHGNEKKINDWKNLKSPASLRVHGEHQALLYQRRELNLENLHQGNVMITDHSILSPRRMPSQYLKLMTYWM